MALTRRAFAASLTLPLVPNLALAQGLSPLDMQRNLIWGAPSDIRAALDAIVDHGDPDMAPGLIMAMRFARDDGVASAIAEVLQGITGEDHSDWFAWMLWQESRPDIMPHPSYIDFKREIYTAIDRDFGLFFEPSYLAPEKMGIRLEEITWGGVVKDGIPALNNPALISADEASYLLPDDLVFGVSINGDARAYPLRIMGWHEMFNDVVGGVPVALAYCTLCGSGILFETDLGDGSEPLIFGSSGFLYRSNKLMYDQRTHSLWNQFTGRPVVGPLVESGIELAQQPVVITSWENWRSDNPETKALSLDTGYLRDYGSGVVYRDYFTSTELTFPTIVDQTQHRQKDYVFAVRQFGAAKAWPLTAFADQSLINDSIAARPLVLIGEESTRSVRAYERGELSFAWGDAGQTGGRLWDGTQHWQVTEAALIAEDGQTLARVAGHIAYWFAWNGYMGEVAEVYEP